MSVGLSAENVIEMLPVRLWACLQRVCYLHMLLGCFIGLIEMLRVCVCVCVSGCLPRMYYLHLFLTGFVRLIEMLRVSVCGAVCREFLHFFTEVL